MAERGFARLARRPIVSVVAVGGVALVTHLALALLAGIPAPRYHDEFSYLLAADTYRHGRLGNPPHPLWMHFESIHVLSQPTYASKYPPGQGLVLALGRVIGGHFIAGAWLATALACAAMTWMLRAWVRPRLALLGGLLTALHPTVVTWGRGYWGGSVALLGGALLLGGLRRAATRPGWREAGAMGTGMAILALSRPFEGMVLSLLGLAAWIFWRAPRRDPAPLAALAAVLPGIVLPVAASAGFLALVNATVTGRADRLPYLEYEERYTNVPLFLFQPLRTRTLRFHNSQMREFEESFQVKTYREQKSMGFARGFLWAGAEAIGTYLPLAHAGTSGVTFGWGEMAKEVLKYLPWIVLQLPLVLSPWSFVGRPTRAAALLLGGFTAVLLMQTWKHPHYAAPAFGLALVLTLWSLRLLRQIRPGGRILVRSALALYVVWPVLLFAVWPWIDRAPNFGRERAHLQARLVDSGGRHLILTRYGPRHNVHEEWVYNGADIDGAAVVWARELEPASNRRLLDYFADRRAWLLEADAPTPRLVPYPRGGGDEQAVVVRGQPDGHGLRAPGAVRAP